MLIIEGPDCVGKTSLATALAIAIRAITNRPIKGSHLGPEGQHWKVQDYISTMEPWTIQDRYNISEWVYGKQYRGKTKLSWDEHRQVNKAIGAYGGLIIFVTAGNGVYGRLLDLHHSRGELYDQISLLDTNKGFIKASNRVKSDADIACFDIHPIMQPGTGKIRYPSSQEIVGTIARIYARKQQQFHGHK